MFFILPIIFTALAPFFSLSCSVILIALFFILKKLLVGSLFLTCGLPTLVGAATFHTASNGNNNKNLQALVLQFLLPLFCMILFIMHPVAGSAFLYSFYWLIPIAIYFLNIKNIFLMALSATFVSHAVGSILYLYVINMPAGQWLALVPVVAFERLLATFGIMIIYVTAKIVFSSDYKNIFKRMTSI